MPVPSPATCLSDEACISHPFSKCLYFIMLPHPRRPAREKSHNRYLPGATTPFLSPLYQFYLMSKVDIISIETLATYSVSPRFMTVFSHSLTLSSLEDRLFFRAHCQLNSACGFRDKSASRVKALP